MALFSCLLCRRRGPCCFRGAIFAEVAVECKITPSSGKAPLRQGRSRDSDADLKDQVDAYILLARRITASKVTVIGAILKEAEYRIARNYMSAITGEHILAGHAWSAQLEQAASRFNTSTTSGMGPTRQSEPL